MPDASSTHSTECMFVRISKSLGSKPGWCADMHVCALAARSKAWAHGFEIISYFLRPSTCARISMWAFNARNDKPVIGEIYRRLVSRGETIKQAMTA